MSYDLLVGQAGIGEEDNERPIGTREMVVRILEQTFPELEWETADFGVCEDAQGSAEFDIGNNDPVVYFGVVLRGLFIDLMARLHQMAQTQGWQIFDPQEGDVL